MTRYSEKLKQLLQSEYEYSEGVISQILFLEFFGNYGNGLKIRKESLDFFVENLISNSGLPKEIPYIFLTWEGNIFAQWSYPHEYKCIGLEFKQDSIIRKESSAK